MSFLSLFFDVEDKNVFILGTGEVATRRANRFLDKGANVVLVGSNINSGLVDKGAILKSIGDIEHLVSWCDIVVLASGDRKLCDYVSSISGDKLVNRADIPFDGDLIVPTSFFIGGVEVSLYTHGKSPLMARELRKKIQETITESDIFEIELQDYCRQILKSKVPNQKDRKEILYSILNNTKINELIKNKKFKEAKKYTKTLLNKKIKEI